VRGGARQLVEATYAHHDEILREIKNKLWFAVGNLCLKAWEQRVKGLRSQGMGMNLGRPACVTELYLQRCIKERFEGVAGENSTGVDFPNVDFSMGQDVQNLGGQWGDMDMPGAYVPFDDAEMRSMDWAYWQTLFDASGVPLFHG